MPRLLALVFLLASTASVLSAQTNAPSWGGSDESLLTVHAFAFELPGSDFTYARSQGGSRYITGGSGTWEWSASVSLPTGALVTGLELMGCDDASTGTLTVGLQRNVVTGGVEDGLGIGTSFDTGLAAAPGCDNFTHTFPIPAPVMNTNNAFRLWVQQSMSVTNGDLRFMAVRVRYKLQVSPSPGIATFSDVPTNHPFFRWVEAISAAGITGGCGPGIYCPDDPITRGQMAVFLSVALGLHFPN
jgi:hypothetical protein